MGLWQMPKWPPCKCQPELPDLAAGLIACVGSGMASQAALVIESLTGSITL
jgi:hypothetical protein